MTIRELQDDIIRIKKKKESAYLLMPIRDMKYGKLRITSEILLDSAVRLQR